MDPLGEPAMKRLPVLFRSPLVCTSLVIAALLCVVSLIFWLLPEDASHPSEEVLPGNLQPDPPPPDPRLHTTVPFRNIRPEVQYVGDGACQGCHADISKTYTQHPMGRSASNQVFHSTLERWDTPPTLWRGPYRLSIMQKSSQRFHTVQLAKPTDEKVSYSLRLDVAIGSGTRGRSYLSFEHSALWQSPISWFSQEQRWDISPGFDLDQGGRRPVHPDCLYCHVHHVEPIAGSINRYREPLFALQVAIGCERCHGPGQLHVQERSNGPPPDRIDTSIVNPRHLAVSLQQDICRQCHLQGQVRVHRRGRQPWEYRPGLPWDQFVTVCIRNPDWSRELRSVSQFEQLETSRCFIASGGQLLCTSCHDPHSVPHPNEREQFYRQRCLHCHTPQSCSLPPTQRQRHRDSCTTCHMPRLGSGNIAHTSITDHRIPRRPAPVSSEHAHSAPPSHSLPIIPYRNPQPSPGSEQERDWGVALAHLSLRVPPGPHAQNLAQAALSRLESALSVHCGDITGWIALSEAHLTLGQFSQAWQAAEYALQLQPDHELALRRLADTALALRRWDRAEAATQQLLRLNPSCVDYYLLRAAVRIAQRQWELAEHNCQQALAIHPLHPHIHLYLAVCRQQRGDPITAQMHLESALELSTSVEQRQHFREWFRQQTRAPSP